MSKLDNTVPCADDRLIYDCLTFFGIITASVTHELNNVVSIIDQTAGLLEDMVAGTSSGQALDPSRVERAVGSLQKQTERGSEIIRRLNTFAHSADYPVREFEIGEALDNLVALYQRPANMKRVTLCYEKSREPLKIDGSPYLFQYAVFLLIRQALDSAGRDGRVKVSTVREEENIKIVVAHSSSEIAVEIPFDELNRALRNLLPCSVEVGENEGENAMVFTYFGT